MSTETPSPERRNPLGAHGITHAAFAHWLTASCTAQGVPLTVRDPAVIAQVTALFGASRSPRNPRAATWTRPKPPHVSALQQPSRLRPVTARSVRSVRQGDAGSDTGMVPDRVHDGLFAVEAEGARSAA